MHLYLAHALLNLYHWWLLHVTASFLDLPHFQFLLLVVYEQMMASYPGPILPWYNSLTPNYCGPQDLPDSMPVILGAAKAWGYG